MAMQAHALKAGSEEVVSTQRPNQYAVVILPCSPGFFSSQKQNCLLLHATPCLRHAALLMPSKIS